MTVKKKHTVLLIDDHPVVTAGIRVLLDGHAEFMVCGEATHAAAACMRTELLRPDLIVADLQMGRQDSLTMIGDLLKAHSSARILVYSRHNELDYARRVLHAGAQGYVMKSEGLRVLVDALRALARGHRWFSQPVQRAFIEALASGNSAGSRLDHLSNRELQIFQLLGAGISSSEIASELNLSIKTVGSHRENLKAKFGLKTARDLERYAEQHAKTGRIPAGAS